MHDELFSRQHALATFDQLVARGMTRRQIQLALQRGDLLHSGQHHVYRHAGSPTTDLTRPAAAVLAAGPNAALSHRAGAAHWGTRAFRSDLVEVSIREGQRKLNTAVVHRMRDLTPEWVTTHKGIRVTTPARTLVDLGMVISTTLVARVMEEWLADRVVAVRDVRLACEALGRRGRQGVAVCRVALDERALADEPGDSTDEHLIATILARYGAPAPVLRPLITVGGEVYEPDYAYPEELIAIELRGFHPHTRSRQTFERFGTKSNDLQRAGWVVLQYTPSQVRQRPWAIAREIDELRRRRAGLAARLGS
ncbi:MAG TPA: hypothetical protein VF855_03735 [Acidimicrobiales bacterium]